MKMWGAICMNHPFGRDTSDLHLVVQRVTRVLIKIDNIQTRCIYPVTSSPNSIHAKRQKEDFFLLLIINKRMRVTPSNHENKACIFLPENAKRRACMQFFGLSPPNTPLRGLHLTNQTERPGTAGRAWCVHP